MCFFCRVTLTKMILGPGNLHEEYFRNISVEYCYFKQEINLQNCIAATFKKK